MALAANALTTLSTLKTELGIAVEDTSRDALLERWVNEASAAIEKCCSRSFALVTVLEKLRGAGTKQISLTQIPVTHVESVTLDDVVLAADEFEVADYEAGILSREDGWPESGQSAIGIAWTPIPGTGRRNIEVQYSGGYVLPKDVVPAGVSQSAPSLVQALVPPASPPASGTLVVTTAAPGGGAASYAVFWNGVAICNGVVEAGALPAAVPLGGFSADLAGFLLTIASAAGSLVTYTVVGAPDAVARTLPPDLERGCLEIVKALQGAQLRDPAVSSEQLGDYSVSYAANRGAEGIIPASALPLIDAYSRLDVGDSIIQQVL